MEEELSGLEGEEERRVKSELLCPGWQARRGEHQGVLSQKLFTFNSGWMIERHLNLYLSDQLVGDLFAEELVRLAVLHVDVELPHQLEHLVHAAARARRDWQLGQGRASPASHIFTSLLAAIPAASYS